MKPRVLILSDNGIRHDRVKFLLRNAEVIHHEVGDVADVHEEFAKAGYDACVLRTQRVMDSQFELFQIAKSRNPHARILIWVDQAGVEDAVRCMKAGAADFIAGDSFDERIEQAINRLLPRRINDEPGSFGADLTQDRAGDVFLGANPKIQEVLTAIKLVAKSKTAVLITGESGTGKELIARMIHQQSDRMRMAFVAINCAAIPRDLIESELFGHEKGAFTGATTRKEGCFELANKGTLFFDEVGEMNPDTQAKLLRAIEHQSFRRLGGKEEVTVDVRVVAATNKNIYEAMKSGEFREDLYYRFSVIEIHIPPLRERKDDLPLLLGHFLKEFGEQYSKVPQRFSDESIELLMEYDWPGNIRELRNIVERAVVICPHRVIAPRYLPQVITRRRESRTCITIPLGISAHEAEKKLILETLAVVNNNKSKAARILGLSRKTLHNKLQEFGSSNGDTEEEEVLRSDRNEGGQSKGNGEMQANVNSSEVQ
ncbi:MAG TPA: sigma-54 dependent transcriptional regulator [Bacteroidota bacterium]|nr:sigma-54 dependent transcriptional regulator [Bacteroidota bacterium]